MFTDESAPIWPGRGLIGELFTTVNNSDGNNRRGRRTARSTAASSPPRIHSFPGTASWPRVPADGLDLLRPRPGLEHDRAAFVAEGAAELAGQILAVLV